MPGLLDFFRSVPEKLGFSGAQQAADDSLAYDAAEEERKRQEQQQRQLEEARQAYEAEQQRLAEQQQRQEAQIQQARARFDQLKQGAGSVLGAVGQAIRDVPAGLAETVQGAWQTQTGQRVPEEARGAMAVDASEELNKEYQRQAEAYARENEGRELQGVGPAATVPGALLERGLRGVEKPENFIGEQGILRDEGPVERALKENIPALPIPTAAGMRDLYADIATRVARTPWQAAQAAEQGRRMLRAADTGRTAEEMNRYTGQWEPVPGEAPKELTAGERAAMAAGGLANTLQAAASAYGLRSIPAALWPAGGTEALKKIPGLPDEVAEAGGDVLSFFTHGGAGEQTAKIRPDSALARLLQRTGAITQEEREAARLLSARRRAGIAAAQAAGAAVGAGTGIAQGQQQGLQGAQLIAPAISGAVDVGELVGGMAGEGLFGRPGRDVQAREARANRQTAIENLRTALTPTPRLGERFGGAEPVTPQGAARTPWETERRFAAAGEPTVDLETGEEIPAPGAERRFQSEADVDRGRLAEIAAGRGPQALEDVDLAEQVQRGEVTQEDLDEATRQHQQAIADLRRLGVQPGRPDKPPANLTPEQAEAYSAYGQAALQRTTVQRALQQAQRATTPQGPTLKPPTEVTPEGVPSAGRGGYTVPGRARQEPGSPFGPEWAPLTGSTANDLSAALFSRLKPAVDALPNQGDPSQILRALQKNQQVPNEEITWTGLEDYLTAKAQQGEMVTKAELASFLDANRIQIYEARYGYEPGDPAEAQRVKQAEAQTQRLGQDFVDAEHAVSSETLRLFRPQEAGLKEEFAQRRAAGTYPAGYQRYEHPGHPQAAIADAVQQFVEHGGDPSAPLANAYLKRLTLEDQNRLDDLRRAYADAKREYAFAREDLATKRRNQRNNLNTLAGGRPKWGGPGRTTGQYAGYTLPGHGEEGANYREFLITLAPRQGIGQQHYGTHWTEADNVIGHLRTTDRMTPDGQRVLVIEEFQSDWHERGRKYGYYQPRTAREILASEEYARLQDLYRQEREAEAALQAHRETLDFSALDNQEQAALEGAYERTYDFLKERYPDVDAEGRPRDYAVILSSNGEIMALGDASDFATFKEQANGMTRQRRLEQQQAIRAGTLQGRRQNVWYYADTLDSAIEQMASADPEYRQGMIERDTRRTQFKEEEERLNQERGQLRRAYETLEMQYPEVGTLLVQAQARALDNQWAALHAESIRQEDALQALGYSRELLTRIRQGSYSFDPEAMQSLFDGATALGAQTSPEIEAQRQQFIETTRELNRIEQLLMGKADRAMRLQERANRYLHADDAQPAGPFQETWETLLARRALQIALGEQYQMLGWTDGATQAHRYDPARVIDQVAYSPLSGNVRVRMGSVSRTLTPDEALEGLGQNVMDKLKARAQEEIAAGRLDPHGAQMVVMGQDELGALTSQGKTAQGLIRYYDTTLPQIFEKLTGPYGLRPMTGVVLQFPERAPDAMVEQPSEGGEIRQVPNAQRVNLLPLSPEAAEAMARQPLLYQPKEPAAGGLDGTLGAGAAGATMGRDGEAGALALGLGPRFRPPSPNLDRLDALAGGLGALAGSLEQREEIERRRREGEDVGLGEELARTTGAALLGGVGGIGLRRAARRGRLPGGLVDTTGLQARGPGSPAAERLEPSRGATAPPAGERSLAESLGLPRTSEYRADVGRWSTEPGTDIIGRQPQSDEETLAKTPGAGARPFTQGAAQQTAGVGGEGAPYTAYAQGSIGRAIGDAFSAARQRLTQQPGYAQMTPDQRAVVLAQDAQLQQAVDALLLPLNTPEFQQKILRDQISKQKSQNKLREKAGLAPKPMPTGPFPVWNPMTGQPFHLVDLLRQFQDGVNAGGLEWYEDVSRPLIDLATDSQGGVDGMLLEELLHAWTVGGHQLDPSQNMRVTLASVRLRNALQQSGRLQTLVDAYRAGEEGELKSDPAYPRTGPLARPKPSAAQVQARKDAINEVKRLLVAETGRVITPPYKTSVPLMAQHADYLLDYWTNGSTDVPSGTKLANYYSNARDALRAAANWLSVPDRWEFRRLGASQEASGVMAVGEAGRQMSQISMALNEELARAVGVAPHQYQAAAWTGYNRWTASGKTPEQAQIGQIPEVLNRTTNERQDFVHAFRQGQITPLPAGLAAGTGPGGGPGAGRTVEEGFQHQPRLPQSLEAQKANKAQGIPAVRVPISEGQRTRSSAESRRQMREAIALQGRALAVPGARQVVRSARVFERLLARAGLQRAGTRLGGITPAQTPGAPADSWQVPALDEAGIPNHLDVRDDPTTGQVWASGHLPQEHEATVKALAGLTARAMGADEAYVVRPLFGQDAAGVPNNVLVVSDADLQALGKTAADLPPHVRGPQGDVYVVADFDGTQGGIAGLEQQLVSLGFDPDPTTGNILGATFDVQRVATPDDASVDALIDAAGTARRPTLERVRDGLRGTAPQDGQPAAAVGLLGASPAQGARGRGYRYGPDSGRTYALPGLEQAGGRVPDEQRLPARLRPGATGPTAEAEAGTPDEFLGEEAEGEGEGEELTQPLVYDQEAMRRANRTARSRGAFTQSAVANLLPTLLTPEQAGRVLDFGAGPEAVQANRLRQQGYDVTAHEFGGNQVAGVHDPDALAQKYDTVYASKVLNVQEDAQMLDNTLREISGALSEGGRAILNYPGDPRKLLDSRGQPLSAQGMEAQLREYFGQVQRIAGTPAEPIWDVRQPRYAEEGEAMRVTLPPEFRQLATMARIEGKPGRAVMGINRERLKKVLGGNLYSGDLGQITVKELIQNAVDAMRPKGRGTITVDANPEKRTIRIKDEGLGMSPEVATGPFLDISGSDKPEDASGGFGLAKVAYLSNAENIEVDTVWEDPQTGIRWRTTLSGSGDDWADLEVGLKDHSEQVQPDANGVLAPTGTEINLTLKEGVKFSAWSARDFMKQFVSNTTLPFDFRFSHRGVDMLTESVYDPGRGVYVERPIIKQNYPIAARIPFQGGTFEIRLSPDVTRTPYPSLEIMNNGLPQFRLPIYFEQEVPLPTKIIVDVRSKAGPEEPDYPFEANRENLRADAKKALEEYAKNQLYRDAVGRETKKLQEAIKKAPRYPGTGFRVVNSGGYPQDAVDRMLSGEHHPIGMEAGKKAHARLLRTLQAGFKDIQQVLNTADPRGNYLAATFYGWGLGKEYYAINVPTRGLFGEGSPNHILLNPHTLWRGAREDALAELRGRSLDEPGTGRSRYYEDDEALPGEVSPKEWREIQARHLAAHMASDHIHELTHNKAWGHDASYAGVQTKNGGIAADELVALKRKLQKLLLEDKGALLSQLRDEANDLENAGAAAEDVFAKVGSSRRVEGIRVGQGATGEPAGRGVSAGRAGSGAGAGLRGPGGEAGGTEGTPGPVGERGAGGLEPGGGLRADRLQEAGALGTGAGLAGSRPPGVGEEALGEPGATERAALTGPLHERPPIPATSTSKAHASVDRAYNSAVPMGVPGRPDLVLANLAGHSDQVIQQLLTGPTAGHRNRLMTTVAEQFDLVKEAIAQALDTGIDLGRMTPEQQTAIAASPGEMDPRAVIFRGGFLTGNIIAGVNSRRLNRRDQNHVYMDVHAITAVAAHNAANAAMRDGTFNTATADERVARVGQEMVGILFQNVVHELTHQAQGSHDAAFHAYMEAYKQALDQSGVMGQAVDAFTQVLTGDNHGVVRALVTDLATLQGDGYAGPWQPGALAGKDARQVRIERDRAQQRSGVDPFASLLRPPPGRGPGGTAPGAARGRGRYEPTGLGGAEPGRLAPGLPGGRGQPVGPRSGGDTGDLDLGPGAGARSAADVRGRSGRPDAGLSPAAQLRGSLAGQSDLDSTAIVQPSGPSVLPPLPPGGGPGGAPPAPTGTPAPAGGTGGQPPGGGRQTGTQPAGASGAAPQRGKTSTLTSLGKLTLLLSPRGLLRQALQSAIQLPYQPLERGVAGALALPERAMRAARGQSTADLPGLGEAGAMLGSYGRELGPAFGEAWNTLRGRQTSQTSQAYNPQSVRGLTDAGFRLVSFFDTMAQHLTREAELAAQTRRGVTGQAATDVAEASGKYRTLQQDMEKWAQHFDDFRRSTPGGAAEWILPFWKIPYNGIKYDLERSPLGLAKTVLQETTGLGGRAASPTERYERLARGIVGSAVAFTIFQWVMNDRVSGEEPDNPTEKDAWKAEGRTPFSIRVGDRWIPTDYVPGLHQAIVQATALRDFVREQEQSGRPWDADAYSRMATRYVVQTIYNSADRPFFEGFFRLGQALRGQSGARDEALKDWALQQAGGYLPGAAIARDIERAGSPVERAPRNPIERSLSGLPGLSGNVPVRRDAYGRVIERPGSDTPILGGLERALNPLPGRRAMEVPRRYTGARSLDEDRAIADAKRAVDDFEKAPLQARRPTPQERRLAARSASDYTANLRSRERARLEKERAAGGGGTSPLTRLVYGR